MQKIYKNIIICFFLIIPTLSNSQVVFDTIIGEPYEKEYVTDIIRLPNNQYLVSGIKGEIHNYNSFFFLINENGVIYDYTNFPQENNTLIIDKIIRKNTELLFIGKTGKIVENEICLYSYNTDCDFQWQKNYELYKQDTIINAFLDYAINSSNEIVIMGSAGLDPYFDGKPFIFKTNFDGDSLFLKKNYNISDGFPFIFDIDTIPNTNKYFVAGYEFRNPSNVCECNIVTLSSNLEIENIFRPLPIGHPYDSFWGNSQIEFITDTTFLSVSRKLISNSKLQEEEICVQLYDISFNLHKEVSWGADNNSMDYFSSWGLDFINKSAIYVGATSPIDMVPQTINYMMLTKLDENLDIVWTKFYGGNASYRLDHVVATEDCGCLMVGKYLYPDTMNYEDIIILKVDADGNSSLPTGIENTESLGKDIIVYPNPTTGIINIQKGQQIQNATIEIYDLNGKLIIKKQLLSDISTVDLANNQTGIYFYNIIIENKITDNGKIILNK